MSREVQTSNSAPPPFSMSLSLSHHYSLHPTDPSVSSPRRSHHSPSFSLPSPSVSFSASPPPSHWPLLFTAIGFWWRGRAEERVWSAVSSICAPVCVWTVWECVWEKVADKAYSRLRVCVTAGEDTHGVGASTGYVAWKVLFYFLLFLLFWFSVGFLLFPQ